MTSGTTEVFYTPTLSQLQKQLEVIRADRATLRTDKLSSAFIVRSVPTNLVLSQLQKQLEVVNGLRTNQTINLLTRLKVNNSKAQVFFSPVQGQVIRLKTGDSKLGQRGIMDPSVQRKEPVQFWN